MRTRDFHIASGSRFGQRVAALESEKESIAETTVQQVLWPQDRTAMNPLFISDGSSTSYVWCYYLKKWMKESPDEELVVYTNNVDVPLQLMLTKGTAGRIRIEDAPGTFSFKDCANFGSDTVEWVARVAKECCCVLATSWLDIELGPCSNDKKARAVKRAVMENARQLVLLADHTKFGFLRDFKAESNADAWREWRDKKARDGRLFVVTNDLPNANTQDRQPFKTYPDTRSQKGIENDNWYLLRAALQGQFIVTP